MQHAGIETRWMTFADLESLSGFRHGFVLRQPEMETRLEREEALLRLKPWHDAHVRSLGFEPDALLLAEQLHGVEVAVDDGFQQRVVPGVDGLVSNRAGTVLGIYVADCCAVYVVDPVAGSFGLAHSGKKGSEAGIIERMIQMMVEHHGANPKQMLVRLGPCIRPPAYEVDFVQWIVEGARRAGVPANQIRDDGMCTTQDLDRFYSYRAEKGFTGRMLALLGRVCGKGVAGCQTA